MTRIEVSAYLLFMEELPVSQDGACSQFHDYPGFRVLGSHLKQGAMHLEEPSFPHSAFDKSLP